jgi:pimeloyl-ACP methyl ester carboxylesterase
LSDVILVGHSFGGNAISGTADTIPGKIRHLVYLDSLMVEGGKRRSTTCRRMSSPRAARPRRKPAGA